MKKLDLESHYYIPEILEYFTGRTEFPIYYPDQMKLVYNEDYPVSIPVKMKKLLQAPEERLVDMNAFGITKQVLIVSAGITGIKNREDAKALSRKANCFIHDAMTKYPDRFSGFAALPYQDVNAAVAELEFCVKEWNFFGALGFSNFGPTTLDDPIYLPILEKAAELDAPIYIHPLVAHEGRQRGLGKVLATASFGFGVDVCTTVIRMMLMGCFDKYPNLKIFIGHMGEYFPFIFGRTDERFLREDRAPAINQQSFSHYFMNNVWITTSGVYAPESFRCSHDILGIEKILFASDYPFGKLSKAVEYIEGLPLSTEDREKVYSSNVKKFFKRLD